MPTSRPLQSVLQVSIGTIVLALIVRTWLVMGLVAPVMVAGSSMAPTLRGEHLRVECPSCAAEFSLGAEFTTGLSEFDCPQCGKGGISLEHRPLHRGDSLVVDRHAMDWHTLQRGDLVVLHNPTDGSQLCVKRIWGLPGEEIALRNGDVFVNGSPVDRPIRLQRAVRQLVHRESENAQRWQPDHNSSWERREQYWQVGVDDSPIEHWLRYQSPDDQLIYDDVPYNADLTRRLNSVRDVMLSAEVRLDGTGFLLLIVDDGLQSCSVRLDMSDYSVTASVDQQQISSANIPERVLNDWQNNWKLIELSNFDRQLLLAIDAQEIIRVDLPPDARIVGTASPFAIGARQLTVSVRRLELYCDVYFTPQAVGQIPLARTVYDLGPGQYFLLGDNSPVSIDSRSWGAVPERLFVGRPLGVR